MEFKVQKSVAVFALTSLVFVLPFARCYSISKSVTEDENELEKTFELPRSGAEEFAKTFATKNASLIINFSQKVATVGSLFTLYGRPHHKVFEIESDGNNGQLTISFLANTGGTGVINIPRNLADGEWHRLILELKGSQLKILIDCDNLVDESYAMMSLDDLAGPFSQPSVWIGRRNRFHSIFEGSIKEFTLESGQASEKICADSPIDNSIGSTDGSGSAGSNKEEQGDEAPNLDKAVDYLKHRVGYLENEFKRWRGQVQGYESQLKHLQLHQRGCQVAEFPL